MPLPRIAVIINQNSGTEGERDDIKARIKGAFTAHDLEADIFVAESGEDLMEFAERAAKSDAEIIVAGGGDGTISGVASKIVKTEKTLGVLPLGTLNHFAKDLQIPLEIEESVRVIAENHSIRVDAGEVNGRIFINNSSIGLYPRIVRRREQQESLGRGKWSSAFWAAIAVLRRSPFLEVKLNIENQEIRRKTPFVFVGNNEYEMNFLNIGSRKHLNDGLLSVYFLHRSGRAGLFLLALRLIFGRLRQAKDFEAVNTRSIEIKTRHKRLLVAFDGEVEMLDAPLCYRVHPQALRVIVPKESEK